jgi:hypothetical protein
MDKIRFRSVIARKIDEAFGACLLPIGTGKFWSKTVEILAECEVAVWL